MIFPKAQPESWRLRIARWLFRSTLNNPDGWLRDFFTGGSTSAGVPVTADSAQQSATVFACVQVRSQDLAKLPVPLYQRTADGGRRRATGHPLYDLINRRPNARQTAYEFREMMQAALDLRGNAYARITRDGRARPIELLPLSDGWVTPLRTGAGEVFYDVRMYGQGPTERLSTMDVLHLKDRSDDGFVGKSCIQRARDAVSNELAQGRFGASFYANGARPGGLLIPKSGKIGEEGRRDLRTSWNEQFQGPGKNHGVAVLGEEFDYKPLAMTNLDAQFLESKKLSRAEIAAIFRVPPHKVGIMDNATFSNIEHQALEYVTDTLMPVAVRWEEALNVALLRESEQDEYFFEFMFDALLRGAFLTRMQGYALMRQWGAFSVNDINRRENWPLLPADKGGDERLAPLNMWPLGKERPVATTSSPPAKEAYYSAPHGRGLLKDDPRVR